MTITHERLLQLLHYCPETGIFTNKVNRGRAMVGSRAGSLHKIKRYRYLSVNGVEYREHKLAWFYYYGVWPVDELDHKDHDKSNNAIDNLRPATRSENNINKGMMSRNTSGYKGVSFNKTKEKYYAIVGHNKKNIHIGVFNCPIEAAKAYDSKALELHGEYAVTNASLGLV